MTGLGVYLLTETSLPQGTCNILRCEVGVPCVSYALLTNHYNANVGASIQDLDFERSVLWQIFKRGSIISFGTLVEFETAVSYRIFLTRALGMDLQYRLHYYSFEQYENLSRARSLTHELLIGMMVAL
jgi:hypothetical protein